MADNEDLNTQIASNDTRDAEREDDNGTSSVEQDVSTAKAQTDDKKQSSETSVTLSKSQLKKKRKRERTLAKQKQRKLEDKAKRRAAAELQGRNLAAEEQMRIQRTMAGDSRRRRQALWDAEKLPLAKNDAFQICLDCSFEKLMTDKEIASLASQLRYCYSYNKKAALPCLWTATNLTGTTLSLLQKETGFEEWHHRAFTGTSLSLAEYYRDRMDSIVYLTSDAETTLTELQNDKIYVIGGIVDRNRFKGAARQRAEAHGVATAKLPLAEHLAKMPATRVLTCNHVFDILLKYREFGKDWGRALQEVLPSRKQAEYIQKDIT